MSISFILKIWCLLWLISHALKMSEWITTSKLFDLPLNSLFGIVAEEAQGAHPKGGKK